MKELSVLRKDLKKYIDTADEKTIKIIHAMLEADQENDWWENLSEAAKSSVERGLKDAEAGRIVPHEVVMKKYKKWLSK